MAAFEGGSSHPRGGRRFVVHVSPADFARFEPSREYLERQWAAMLLRLAERSQQPQRAPEVALAEETGLPRGDVEVEVEQMAEPLHLNLRVRRGLPQDGVLPLRGSLVVGRGYDCDLVLPDPRVSRRHLAIDAGPQEVRFRDLGSANGIDVNREERRDGRLDLGDIVRLGDTELIVEAGEP